MPNPTIVPKKSTLAGAIPTTSQLSLGEICVNHSDRRIYSRNPSTGEIYKLAGAKDAPDRVFVFDAVGDTTYLGYLLYTDVPVHRLHLRLHRSGKSLGPLSTRPAPPPPKPVPPARGMTAPP
jgi:hypothetical protein